MSKENLSNFLNQVADSEELQAQIGDEIDAESLIALGAECGCEFTEEDLQVSAEISEEELDAVAGGRRTIPPQNLKSKYQLKSAADLTSSTHPDGNRVITTQYTKPRVTPVLRPLPGR